MGEHGVNNGRGKRERFGILQGGLKVILQQVPMIPITSSDPNESVMEDDLEKGVMEDDLPTYEEATGPESGKYSRQTSNYRNLVRQATVIVTGNSEVTEETVDHGSTCCAVSCMICCLVPVIILFIYMLCIMNYSISTL